MKPKTTNTLTQDLIVDRNLGLTCWKNTSNIEQKNIFYTKNEEDTARRLVEYARNIATITVPKTEATPPARGGLSEEAEGGGVPAASLDSSMSVSCGPVTRLSERGLSFLSRLVYEPQLKGKNSNRSEIYETEYSSHTRYLEMH